MSVIRSQDAQAEGIPVSSCRNRRAAVTGAHSCASRGQVQPLPAGASFFAFFGLPQKLTIEPASLEGQFHMLSWKLHPDNFVRASEFERNLSLERSSQLNDAYRTLREPIARVEYLLEHLGVRKEGTTKQQAPPELLEEVFELNESLDELREAKAEGGDLAALKVRLAHAEQTFQEKLAEVDAELFQAATQWDAAVDAEVSGAKNQTQAERDAIKKQLNELLNRRSYIRNL